eukprot:TRINITY_DN34_c1_g3_i2.p1 TRINITY_DN34_c1_g3~~TRINITY_DN34_c1_g3_i2.p1  ORF type:complete len:558 (-),score=148.02 TRINITY_DN34_c1_g3_i2:818-2425(-)
MLAKAIECAVCESRDAVTQTLASLDLPLHTQHDCIATAGFSYPEEKAAVGTLKKILTSHEINIGMVPTAVYQSKFLKAMEIILNTFREHYQIPLKMNYDSSKETNDALVDGLYRGQYDITIPSFFLGGFTRGQRLRDIYSSCSTQSWIARFIVRASDNINSIPQLIKKQNENSNLLVTTFGSAESKLVESIYSLKYYQRDPKDASTAIQQLLTNSSHVLSVVDHSGKINSAMLKSTGLALIEGVSLPVSVLVREEGDKKLVKKGVKLDWFESGNSQLRSFFDAAIGQLQEKTIHEQRMGSSDIIPISDCTVNKPSFPNSEALSGISQIIAKYKVMRIGYLESSNQLLSVTSRKDVQVAKGIPSGFVPTLEESIIESVSRSMGVIGENIEIVPVIFQSNSEMFDALENGDIEATSFALAGGSSDEMPRKWKFEQSCSGFGINFKLLTTTTNKTLSELKQLIQGSTLPTKIGVFNGDMKSLAEEILAHSNTSKLSVEIIPNLSDAIGKIISNSIAMYIPDYLTSIPSQYSSLISNCH